MKRIADAYLNLVLTELTSLPTRISGPMKYSSESSSGIRTNRISALMINPVKGSSRQSIR